MGHSYQGQTWLCTLQESCLKLGGKVEGERQCIAASFEQGSKTLATCTCHFTVLSLVARERETH